MPELRIGVFVCHCGINIGTYVDVPQVVDYARGLLFVVHAEHNLFTCSEEGILAIKRAIGEHSLNRVVVSSCSPRTHEPLFRAACEEAGLNKYLFEFVNIRDQCSWVHVRQPEKAKDLVRMGVTKAALLEPLEEIEIEVRPSSVVIGGGIVGMHAALNLASQGFEVHLIEKEQELGGTLLDLDRLFTGHKEAGELVRELVERIQGHEKIETHLGSTIQDVTGFIGNFDVVLNENGSETSLKAGTIIVATGAQALTPVGQYGYGELSNVVTQLELEQRMREGTVDAQNVVMINCVGARAPERTYCGRICCMTAIKNARLIKEHNPKARVWILHRDIMASGVDYEDYYRQSMEKGVRYVRYDLDRLPEVVNGTDGRARSVKVWHQLMGRQLELPADLMVLTTPLVPRPENEHLSRVLKAPLGEDGFFLEAHLKLMPVEFATDGIYLCGAARWPTDTGEAVAQAQAAASKAATPMRRGFVRPESIFAVVNESICSGCGLCESICPFSAIQLQARATDGKQVSHVSEAVCKGCGTCGAACPSGAITMNHFRDAEVMAQIDALANPVD